MPKKEGESVPLVVCAMGAEKADGTSQRLASLWSLWKNIAKTKNKNPNLKTTNKPAHRNAYSYVYIMFFNTC